MIKERRPMRVTFSSCLCSVPDISPHKPKPDSVLDLEAEISNLQKHLRSLERKARKVDVVSH